MSPIRDLQAVFESIWCVDGKVDLTCQGQLGDCASDFKDTHLSSYEHCCRHACLDMHGVDNDGNLVVHSDSGCDFISPCDQNINVLLSSSFDSCPGSGMWLLDSGASVSIVRPVKSFQNPLQAANGTTVAIEGYCKVLIQVEVFNPERLVQPAVVPVNVMVGDCAFPIL